MARKPGKARKPSKAAKRTGAKPATRSARATRGGKRSRPVSISTKAAKHTKAVETIGREKLKPGAKVIGRTRWVRPSKRGLAVLSKEIEKMRRAPRGATFTYKVTVKDAEGRVRHSRDALVLPTAGEISRAKKSKGKKRPARTKRGVAMKALQERIRREVFANRPGLTADQYDRLVELRKISAKRARRYLNALLKEKGVSFKVEIRREI